MLNWRRLQVLAGSLWEEAGLLGREEERESSFYTTLSVMFRKDKSIKKQEKRRGK